MNPLGRVEVTVELVSNCGQEPEPVPPCAPARVFRVSGGEFAEVPDN